MNILVYISDYIVPFLILSTVIYGLLSRINVYDKLSKEPEAGFSLLSVSCPH